VAPYGNGAMVDAIYTYIYGEHGSSWRHGYYACAVCIMYAKSHNENKFLNHLHTKYNPKILWWK